MDAQLVKTHPDNYSKVRFEFLQVTQLNREKVIDQAGVLSYEFRNESTNANILMQVNNIFLRAGTGIILQMVTGERDVTVYRVTMTGQAAPNTVYGTIIMKVRVD